MPQYCFICRDDRHPKDKERHFSTFVHLDAQQLKHGKTITEHQCPHCNSWAARDMAEEIPSQAVVGITPVSESTTVKGSLYRETKFAFGRGDGKAAFRDSGEMNRFMNGQNELGPPVVDDKGNRVRKPDGSIARKGEKFFKYDKGATPRRSAPMPNLDVPNAFCDYSDLSSAGVFKSNRPAVSVPGVRHPVPRYKTLERRKRS